MLQWLFHKSLCDFVGPKFVGSDKGLSSLRFIGYNLHESIFNNLYRKLLYTNYSSSPYKSLYIMRLFKFSSQYLKTWLTHFFGTKASQSKEKWMPQILAKITYEFHQKLKSWLTFSNGKTLWPDDSNNKHQCWKLELLQHLQYKVETKNNSTLYQQYS